MKHKIKEEFEKNFGIQINNHKINGKVETYYRLPDFYENIWSFISQALDNQKKELIEKIKDKNFEFMEECGPDCDDVRHARHKGSWDHYWKMDKFLETIENE